MSGPLIISIEGNIGSGKSTILAQLQTHMKNTKYGNRVVFLLEPVDVWEKIKDPEDNETILQKFYSDPNKYAFPFQVMAYATRLSAIRAIVRKHGPDCIVICERSLEADCNIFAKMLHDDGKIDNVNYQIYEHFYKEYAEDFQLGGVVYINADPGVCLRRIEERSREGESTISLDYLTKCKQYHDTWLHGNDETAPILDIDTNVNVTYNNDKGNVWLREIEKFVEDIVTMDQRVRMLDAVYN